MTENQKIVAVWLVIVGMFLATVAGIMVIGMSMLDTYQQRAFERVFKLQKNVMQTAIMGAYKVEPDSIDWDKELRVTK